MGYIVGTDEAGYGPNLGPLAVSASVWQTSGDPCEVDLYRTLDCVVTGRAAEARGIGAPLAIADSKVLHSPAEGLASLEKGVLAMLALLNRRPANWRGAWSALRAAEPGELQTLPWHADYDSPLPVDAPAAEVDAAVAALASGMATAGVQLLDLRSRAIFPEQWNFLNAAHASKGAVLSRVTLDLAAQTLADLPPAPTCILCDKHGGRDRYADLLYDRFTDAWIEIREEGRERSVYRWRSAAGEPVEARFCARGEAHLPVALASMASKYLRELSMRAFNAWWMARVPGLRATAGYPVDAARFKREIATAQASLGIDDRVLWRAK